MLDYLLPVGALPRHVVRAVLAHADSVTVSVDGNFELVARAFYLEAGAAESQLFAYLRAREFFFPDHGAGNISAVRLFDFAYPFFCVAAELCARAGESLFEFIRRQRQRR